MTVTFDRTLAERGLSLSRTAVRVLQMNLGRVCNIACVHCHVSAGPDRTESMPADVADRCLAWMRRHRPPVVDITGGAPEMCNQFRRLVVGARETGAEVMVRTNLTVLLEPEYEDLAEFFGEQRIVVVASMPCYLAVNVDAQRGEGVFAASVRALRRLNDLGYGRDPALPLHLIYNPGGAALPPDQTDLERDFRRELGKHCVIFDRLWCLTNLPVGRFGAWLRGRGERGAYQRLLAGAFNPSTVDALMCRDTLSVSWRGEVFDCDFHQMAGLPLAGAKRRYLWDLDPATLPGTPIATAAHCFGCTAGSGSSCGGTLV